MSGWRERIAEFLTRERGRRPTSLYIDSLENWRRLRALLERRKAAGFRFQPKEREAFQLLRAATLYEIDALHNFPGDLLHEKWRIPWMNPPGEEYLSVYMDLDEPYFGLLEASTSQNPMIRQMHLASAAVRIPLAVQKAIESRPDAARPFVGSLGLWNTARGDWDRTRLKDCFEAVKTLGHCTTARIGTTEEEGLQNAAVIVVALRDEFGHGETGDPPANAGPAMRAYIEGRDSVISELYTCRIAEAEQALLRWAIDSLGKAD